MPRYRAIESLRGYMAWWVVLGHALSLTGVPSWLHPTISWYAERNIWAVYIFIIVSGFVIAHLLLMRREAYGDYAIRRLFRLAPLFLVTLGLAIATRYWFVIAYDNPGAEHVPLRTERLAAEEGQFLPHLLLHLSLLHGVVPDTVMAFASSTFLAPAWSLSLEWQFYLIAPLLLWAMMARGVIAACVLAATIAMMTLALSGLLGTWRYPSFFFLAVPYFLLGIASRILVDRRMSPVALGLTAVSIAIYVMMSRGITAKGFIVIGAIWFGFLAISLREGADRRIGGPVVDRIMWLIALNPVALALGRVSYSTYLVHVPIFGIVVGSGVLMFGRNDQALIIALTVLAMVIVVPVSFLLHRFVEMPGQALGKRIVAGMVARRMTQPAHAE
jgi:peptidoglycan/LPS O-acetylase OafA/YrhL